MKEKAEHEDDGVESVKYQRMYVPHCLAHGWLVGWLVGRLACWMVG